jgi:hypothetical protein
VSLVIQRNARFTSGTANNPPALTGAGGQSEVLSFEYVAALSQWCFLDAAFPR